MNTIADYNLIDDFNKKPLPWTSSQSNGCIGLTLNNLPQHRVPRVLQLLSFLQHFELTKEAVQGIILNTETNTVLLDDEFMKISLIHWSPGKFSSIHGHPVGGCLLKVLHGEVNETRYDPQSCFITGSKALGVGNVAYIDDTIALHRVGNTSGSSAISIHAYLKQ